MSTKKRCRTASTVSATQWRPLEMRTEKIGVKEGNQIDWQDVTASNPRIHGPIVAHKNGKAYSVAIPYADQFRLIETAGSIATAHNLSQRQSRPWPICNSWRRTS